MVVDQLATVQNASPRMGSCVWAPIDINDCLVHSLNNGSSGQRDKTLGE